MEIAYFPKLIPNSDLIYDMLKENIPWECKPWGNRGGKVNYLPRLCCHSAQLYPVGKMLSTWVSRLFEESFDTHIYIQDIFGNYYRDGKDYLPDHSDRYGDDWVISLSFGTKRLFRFREIDSKKIVTPKYYLESGDIIIFSPKTNLTHKHGIPKQLSIKDGRINLTIFAMIPNPEKILTTVPNPKTIPNIDFSLFD